MSISGKHITNKFGDTRTMLTEMAASSQLSRRRLTRRPRRRLAMNTAAAKNPHAAFLISFPRSSVAACLSTRTGGMVVVFLGMTRMRRIERHKDLVWKQKVELGELLRQITIWRVMNI